jgi:hypothetical protein
VVDAVNNGYGDTINGPVQNIAVRRQEHVEEVRLKDGTVHNSNYIYYTLADVKLDDLLDENLVVQSYDMRTLGGNKILRRLITI